MFGDTTIPDRVKIAIRNSCNHIHALYDVHIVGQRGENVKENSNTPYHKLAQEIADTVVAKQAAYGNSFGVSGQILELLYPNGVPIDQYDDMLCIVRIIDKLKRIATDRDFGGESPYHDIAGYSLLGIVNNYFGGENNAR